MADLLVVSRTLTRCPKLKTMDCGIVVSEFELQLRYYILFRINALGKAMKPLIIYIYIYIYSIMGELSSKLRKNEDDTEISLYWIYLLKLHKNILKYYRSNFSKKSPMTLTAAFRRFQKLALAFPTVSLFKLVNAAVILAFSSSLVLHWVFFFFFGGGGSLNRVPLEITKRIATWRVWWPDVETMWL